MNNRFLVSTVVVSKVAMTFDFFLILKPVEEQGCFLN